MTSEQPRECNKNFNTSDSTGCDKKNNFPRTTNQWYGRQKRLPYEVGGPMVQRLPYVKERKIGCWSAD